IGSVSVWGFVVRALARVEPTRAKAHTTNPQTETLPCSCTPEALAEGVWNSKTAVPDAFPVQTLKRGPKRQTGPRQHGCRKSRSAGYFRYFPPWAFHCWLWPGGIVSHSQSSFVSSLDR